jgi:hypothetical protein
VVLSPAATCTNLVSGGNLSAGIAVGMDSKGFRSGSLSSESESESSFPLMSRVGASQAVLRPRAQRSFTPQVRTLLSRVRATACIPPAARLTTPTAFGSRLWFRRGLFTSMASLAPSPSSPALPSPNTKTSSLVVVAAFRKGVGVDDFAPRPPFFNGGLASMAADVLTRFGGGLALSC